MYRTYGSLYRFLRLFQRIKIRCYNTGRGYASHSSNKNAVSAFSIDYLWLIGLFKLHGISYPPIRHNQISTAALQIPPAKSCDDLIDSAFFLYTGYHVFNREQTAFHFFAANNYRDWDIFAVSVI